MTSQNGRGPGHSLRQAPGHSPRQVHDSLFGQAFAHPARAAGVLRAALPAQVAARIDWDGLQPAPASFVDQVLQQSHADLVFHARFRDDGDALLWLMLEHQSTVERWMALRVVEVEGRMWQHWRVLHPDHERLPAIVPVVVYHGVRSWSAPTCLAGLLRLPVDMPAELARHVTASCFVLDDLNGITDETLRARRLDAFATLSLLALAYGRARDILDRLLRWREELQLVMLAVNRQEQGSVLLSYIAVVNPRITEETMRERLIPELGTEAEDTIMTMGERLMRKGAEQAQEQLQRNNLLFLLRQRFGTLPVPVTERIDAARFAELQRWFERVLVASNLDEVFANA
jgi:Putative transposase, YhgA-like